jgi:signal transduction histidine kinase
VEVADEGSGIDAESRKNIFQPFWKRPDSKGAGVGLAIVREMAELHGGRVSLQDNSPHGSIFRIDFNGKEALCSG